MPLPVPTDEIELKVVDSLRKNEPHVIHVGATKSAPSFSYTIGLWHQYGHPELLITELPFNNANNVFCSAFDRVSEGTHFSHLDQAFRVVSTKLPACFLRISTEVREKHMTLASWAYNREEFDALQCIWPDKAGLFPWDEEYDPDFHQTILAEIA